MHVCTLYQYSARLKGDVLMSRAWKQSCRRRAEIKPCILLPRPHLLLLIHLLQILLRHVEAWRQGHWRGLPTLPDAADASSTFLCLRHEAIQSAREVRGLAVKRDLRAEGGMQRGEKRLRHHGDRGRGRGEEEWGTPVAAGADRGHGQLARLGRRSNVCDNRRRARRGLHNLAGLHAVVISRTGPIFMITLQVARSGPLDSRVGVMKSDPTLNTTRIYFSKIAGPGTNAAEREASKDSNHHQKTQSSDPLRPPRPRRHNGALIDSNKI